MIEFIKELSLNAGSICRKQSGKSIRVSFKNDKDLVTEIDKRVEDYIVSAILKRFPDHGIFGEETGKTNQDSRFCWIIDPIDGTTSFFHGQPCYCVSIALQQENETITGAVYAPVLDQLYTAEKGRGAYLNDKKIMVSSTGTLIHSVLATGFACIRAGLEKNNLTYLNAILPEIRDIRRYGSAALDLCYVADGKLDGFWEMNLNPYDIAAGALIVLEAGGSVCDFKGGSAYPQKGIIATNSLIDKELMKFFL